MFKTILVALDSSELSDRVMQALHQLQIGPDTQVILSHVISPSESGIDRPADLPLPEIPTGLYSQIEDRLRDYQGQLSCNSAIEIVSGDPADEIIRLSNIYNADLILMGSRGLTGVTRILQGSVSSQVAADAHCSVFVVKPA
uniref:UspA domain protein n=1 Tax=Cyanothece sp. (strain PCC 7425 / ATCC 29141) TaxID=395961 RepID=B8HUQ0_CYAP4